MKLSNPKITRKHYSASVFILILIFVSFTIGQTADKPQKLSPYQPAQRRIKGGETHVFEIELKKGEYARAEVEQKNIDVVVSLFDADGKSLIEMDGKEGFLWREAVSIMAETGDAVFQIKIRAYGESEQFGDYTIRLAEVRPANTKDRQRLEAEQHFYKGRKLYLQEKPDYEATIREYEAALKIWQELGDKQWQATAQYSVGLINIELKKYDQSVSELNKAKVLFLEVKDKIGEEKVLKIFSDVTYETGIFYQESKKYNDAIYFYNISLQLSKQIKDKAGETRTLNNIALAHFSSAKFSEAIVYFNELLVIYKDLDNQKAVGIILSNIGLSNKNLNQYEKAETFLLQALNINNELKDQDAVRNNLVALHSIYFSMKKNEKASEYLNKLLVLEKESKDKIEQEKNLNAIGDAHLNSTQYEKAIGYFEQSLQIREENKDLDGQAQLLNKIASAYISLKDISKSIIFFDKLLAIQRINKDQNGEINTFYELIAAANELKEYEKAEKYIRQTLKTKTELKDQEGEKNTLYALVYLKELQKEYKESIDYLDRLLVLEKGNNRVQEGKIVAYLARVYLNLRQFDKARQLSEQALEIKKELKDKEGEKSLLSLIEKLPRILTSADLNKLIEGKINKTETHEYQINLQANDFIQIKVETYDLKWRIISGAGVTLAEIDESNTKEDFKTISFIAKETGDYFVEIKNLDSFSGNYRITFSEKRIADVKDKQRIIALNELFELNKIFGGIPLSYELDKVKVTDIENWRKKYQTLIPVWQKLEDKEILQWLARRIDFLEEIKTLKNANAKFEKLPVTGYGTGLGDGAGFGPGSEPPPLNLTEEEKRIQKIEEENRKIAEEKKKAEELALEQRKKSAFERRKITEKTLAGFPQIKVSAGHSSVISSIAFSKNGKIFATGDYVGIIKLWDFDSGKELRTLIGHTSENSFVGYDNKNSVYSLSFSPDGKTLASGSSDKTVKLWNVISGEEIRSFPGHSNAITFTKFSPDNQQLVTADFNEIKLWDISSGKELKKLSQNTIQSVTLSPNGKQVGFINNGYIKLWNIDGDEEPLTMPGHVYGVTSLDFSPDGKNLVSEGGQTFKFWETTSGRLLKTVVNHNSDISSFILLPDGEKLALRDKSKTIKLFNISLWKLLKTLPDNSDSKSELFFLNDGKDIVSNNGTGINFWNVESGIELLKFAEQISNIGQIRFSPDKRLLASVDEDKNIRLWDVASGNGLKTLTGNIEKPYLLTFSEDGKILVSVDGYYREKPTYKFWDTNSGKELKSITITGYQTTFSISPYSDNKTKRFIAFANDKDIQILDAISGKELKVLTGHSKKVKSLIFSPDGNILASEDSVAVVKLWNVTLGTEIKTFEGSVYYNYLNFSPNGKIVSTVNSQNKEVLLWDVESGKEPKKIKYRSYYTPKSIFFSPDGNEVALLASNDGTQIWNITSGEEIKYNKPPTWLEQKLTKESTNSITTSDGKVFRADIEGNKIVIKDTETEDGVATLVTANKNDWAVIDTNGRWDASDGSQKLMHYSLSTPEGYEVINFSQLKERYYEPNLLQKLLGFNRESLKDVAKFKDVLLPPLIEPIEPEDIKSSVRQVKIKNRNGGIGRVQVFVDGREVIEDARDEKLKANPNLEEYVLSFEIKAEEFIPGQKPDVEVVAWNYDKDAKEQYKGYISSRGVEVFYNAPEGEVEPPTLYAIIGGVSDYKGDELDLRFASKDAEDMYQAIRVSGKNLFGVERMKIKLLSTGENKDSIAPIKENFRRTFEDFAKEAKPNDILFVYLAGHGITLNFGSDIYYYLTQQATTTDKAILSKDSQLLSSSTINSEELTRWHKSIKAKKQVLILDTCAAGAIGNEFKVIEKREISSDAKRAIEKMRDVISFHVLMGSAADSVSYEASQYGQGLLTYSLLQGMKGAALESDGRVDVSKLFNYAAETVPSLAKNIGGIQRPEIRVPIGGTSFPFGLLNTEEDKKLIPLAQIKPIILRPSFQNRDPNVEFDDLMLGRLIKDQLREVSYLTVRGRDTSQLVFVDTDNMPEAIRPSGSYVIEGTKVKVRVTLVKDLKVKNRFEIEGDKNDLPTLVKQIVENILVQSQN